MKAILMSIQPKWCELIASGKKTVEVRKTKPKLEVPFKVYIYCTNTKPYLVWGDVFRGGSWNNEFTHLSGFNRADAEKIWDVFNGKVIGEFVCDHIYGLINFLPYDSEDFHHDIFPCVLEQTCLEDYEIDEYLGQKDGYGWHISNLVIYDKPRELRDFQLPCDHENDCGTCKRAIYCRSTRRFCRCDLEDGLKRPPQSWCYCEEVE